MEIALLLTDKLKVQLPENIVIEHDFGKITIVDHQHHGKFVEGNHCVVKCEDAEIFLSWIQKMTEPGVWLTEGSPKLEQFNYYTKNEFRINN